MLPRGVGILGTRPARDVTGRDNVCLDGGVGRRQMTRSNKIKSERQRRRRKSPPRGSGS
jgi:hypothetical protein